MEEIIKQSMSHSEIQDSDANKEFQMNTEAQINKEMQFQEEAGAPSYEHLSSLMSSTEKLQPQNMLQKAVTVTEQRNTTTNVQRKYVKTQSRALPRRNNGSQIQGGGSKTEPSTLAAVDGRQGSMSTLAPLPELQSVYTHSAVVSPKATNQEQSVEGNAQTRTILGGQQKLPVLVPFSERERRKKTLQSVNFENTCIRMILSKLNAPFIVNYTQDEGAKAVSRNKLVECIYHLQSHKNVAGKQAYAMGTRTGSAPTLVEVVMQQHQEQLERRHNQQSSQQLQQQQQQQQATDEQTKQQQQQKVQILHSSASLRTATTESSASKTLTSTDKASIPLVEARKTIRRYFSRRNESSRELVHARQKQHRSVERLKLNSETICTQRIRQLHDNFLQMSKERKKAYYRQNEMRYVPQETDLEERKNLTALRNYENYNQFNQVMQRTQLDELQTEQLRWTSQKQNYQAPGSRRHFLNTRQSQPVSGLLMKFEELLISRYQQGQTN